MAGTIKVMVPLDSISDQLTYDATTNSLQFDLVAVDWVADGFIALGRMMQKDTETYGAHIVPDRAQVAD